jgi:hypothetical protein
MFFLFKALAFGSFALVLEVIGFSCVFWARSYQEYLRHYYEVHKDHPLRFLAPSSEYINSDSYLFHLRFSGCIACLMGLLLVVALILKAIELWE